MRRSKLLLAVLSVVVIAGCTTRRVDTAAEGKALMQLSRDWSDAAATGDIEAILELWADDAIVMPPALPAVQGKQAIRQFLKGMMQIPGFKIRWEPLSVQVSESGELAYMMERNEITTNDPLGNPVTTYGKAITIWRKQEDGSWKNVVDIWNAAPQGP